VADNRCVCCGEIIPEGMIACPNCLVVSKRQATPKQAKENTWGILKETMVIIQKQLWLYWIGLHLDRYLKVSEKNKRRYWKVQRMADRYNYIFADDLFR
jgi:hypothetical protein